MKYLLIILLFASCTKASQCYNCTFGTSNGVQKPPEEYCGKMPYIAHDANGNEINTFCVPK